MAEAQENAIEITARHRKEQRDLIARITQKKKSATKKTRKGVNEECERLERELQERHAQELAPPSDRDEAQLASSVNASGPEDEAHVEGAGDGMSLSAAPPEPNMSDAAEVRGMPKKQNRAKARLARRAAEQEALVEQAKAEAAGMPDLREQERRRMAQQLNKHALMLREIRADGHCLYAAVADQLQAQELGLEPRIQVPNTAPGHDLPDFRRVRYTVAGYIEQHPDNFQDFMEQPLETYLSNIRNTGEWGGHLEIQALAKAYMVQVNVLHGDGRIDTICASDDTSPGDLKTIWLGYYRHSHGLGEHYNSLRKAS